MNTDTIDRETMDRLRGEHIARLQRIAPNMLLTMTEGEVSTIAVPHVQTAPQATGKRSNGSTRTNKIRKIGTTGQFVRVHYAAAKFVTIWKHGKTGKYVGRAFPDMLSAYDYAVSKDGELWSNELDDADNPLGRIYPPVEYLGAAPAGSGSKTTRKQWTPLLTEPSKPAQPEPKRRAVTTDTFQPVHLSSEEAYLRYGGGNHYSQCKRYGVRK